MQSASAKAGVVHCKHDVVNEFDFPSDVSRMYGVRHVPSFLLFHEGALIDRHRLPDSRVGPYGPVREVRNNPLHKTLSNLCTWASCVTLCRTVGLVQIDSLLDTAMRQVQETVRQQVFRLAPSATMQLPEAPLNQDST